MHVVLFEVQLGVQLDHFERQRQQPLCLQFGEMFGDDRLHAALSVGKKPFDSVKAALEKFIGNRPPEDDISLITLRL